MTALYIIAAVAVLVVLFFLWQGRKGWPALPAWDWHDIRKLLALVFTILGAAILTAMAWSLLNELVVMAKGLIRDLMTHSSANPPPKAVGGSLETIIGVLAWGLKLLLAGVLVVLLSLGFVITPRAFEFQAGALKGNFRGGDTMPEREVKAAEEVEQRVTEEAKAAVADIKAGAAPGDAGLPDNLK